MFYPGRMELTPDAARQACRSVVDQARRFGGALVVNWHDRSLAPERLWNERYRDLANGIEAGGGAWFATAAEAVDWFRWRRSISFRSDPASNEVVVETSATESPLPGARIAIHRAEESERGIEERHFVAGDVVRLML